MDPVWDSFPVYMRTVQSQTGTKVTHVGSATNTKSDWSEFIFRPVPCECMKRNVWRANKLIPVWLCPGFMQLPPKPPLVNQQCLDYKFECDLYDVGYVGYTYYHLHQEIEELKNASSSVGQHFCVKYSSAPNNLSNNFSILKKCKSKFDCLVFEMFFINELRPSLNVHWSESLPAKVFK